MRYLLDSNVFIQAKNRYYAFDICPGFWEWMDYVVANGEVASVQNVCDELSAGNDELADWAKARKGNGCFLTVSDAATQKAFADIANRVQSGSYKPSAKQNFLAGADPWLIAKASVLGVPVVTEEKLNLEIKRKVLIPNICSDLGVKFFNTFDTLRLFSASFVLQKI